MTGHDPLCPVDPSWMDDGYCRWCEVIAKARALDDLRAKVETQLQDWGWDHEDIDAVLDLIDGDQ